MHHHIEGGEAKSDLFSRDSTKHVTWNSDLIFLWFRKINWRELTCVPPSGRDAVEATTNNSIQRAELTLEFKILIEL